MPKSHGKVEAEKLYTLSCPLTFIHIIVHEHMYTHTHMYAHTHIHTHTKMMKMIFEL